MPTFLERNRLFILQKEGLTGGNGVICAVDGKIQGVKGGIHDASAVGTVDQGFVSLYVFVQLNIRTVPDILLATQGDTDLVQKIPVLLAVEFKAVSPQIKETGEAVCFVAGVYIQRDEFFDPVHQLRVGVMGGGDPVVPIAG